MGKGLEWHERYSPKWWAEMVHAAQRIQHHAARMEKYGDRMEELATLGGKEALSDAFYRGSPPDGVRFIDAMFRVVDEASGFLAREFRQVSLDLPGWEDLADNIDGDEED